MSSSDPLAASDQALEDAGKPTKTKRSPLLSLLAIALAIVGGFLSGWSFLTGLAYLLDPRTTHSSLYIALFFVGLGIVDRRHRVRARRHHPAGTSHSVVDRPGALDAAVVRRAGDRGAAVPLSDGRQTVEAV